MVASNSIDDQIPAEASLSGAARLLSNMGETVEISLSPITSKPSTGTTDVLPKDRCLIVGRQAATAHLRIPHKSISRKHAAFYYLQKGAEEQQSELWLRDFGGKYGTMVNSELVNNRSVLLKNGDKIWFGNEKAKIYSVQLDTHPERKAEEKTIPASTSLLEKAGAGLSGRAKRQAEIAAMMASLDENPTYQRVAVEQLEPVRNGLAANLPRAAATHDSNTATRHRIPVSHCFALEQQQSEGTSSDRSSRRRRYTTTCLAVDPSGARFAVGSTDTTLQFYDFGGLDQGKSKAFKSLIPEDGYWPVDLCYSNTGDRIISGTGSVQPIVLSRDGETVIKFVRGDMYVTDQTKTVGHTAPVTSVAWHPLERDIVLTGSLDGSARLWNVNKGKTQFQMLCCDKVFNAKNRRGQRTQVSCVAFHPGGREFAVGTACGSIQIWSPTRVSGRPERAVFDAHGLSDEITGVSEPLAVSSLSYSADGSKLVTRTVGDKSYDSIKVWSANRLSKSSGPILICQGSDAGHEHANAVFSPDGKVICAGVSKTVSTILESGETIKRETGALNFYAIGGESSAEPTFSLDLDSDAGAVVVQWHSKINQIFVGCTNGRTFIYFDPRFSQKGAIGAASKAGRRVDVVSELLRSKAPQGSTSVGEIVTPLYQEILGGKRKRGEKEIEPTSRLPERPATGKHKQGAPGNLNFQQFISDQDVGKAREIAGKDPREALFKYREGKNFVERAYEGNKSKNPLATKTAEEEEDAAKAKKS